VSPPAVPVSRSSIHAPQVSTGEGLNLAGLLDLLAAERPAQASPRRSSRSPGAGLREGMHRWVRRAAAWGAGPQGAWRAW
jgi:hypothetical protein